MVVADVGNTRIKFALLCSQEKQALPVPVATLVWPNGESFQKTALQELMAKAEGSIHCAISGSQLTLLEELADWWPDSFPAPHVIRRATDLKFPLAVDAPEKVGVDRVLNAIAAATEFPGRPAMVIDAGTATTIDLVDASGTFQGGVIMPGYELSAHALHDYTNRLPLIPLREILGAEPEIVGKNTVAALRSGLIWGHVGAVNEIVQRMTEVISPLESLICLITGGAAELLLPHLTLPATYRPACTLQGLGAFLLQQNASH